MAQAGIIKTITGIVNARTPDGQIRQLMAGDMVYENEIIETSDGSEITIELSNGKTLALAENSQVVLDETVIAIVDAQDAVVVEAQALQAALEAGEDIPDEEPAAGEEDEAHDYDLAYYAGDQTRGDVGSYLFGTEYGGEDEDFPDVEGEEEEPLASIEEEPAPLFIVGSNPGGERVDQGTNTSGDDFPYRDDVENPPENDSHTVNPAGEVRGAILGQDGEDILVGDPGSVTLEHLTNNYILMMDYSHSVTDSASLTNLINATKAAIQNLYGRVQHAVTDYEVRINLLPFAGESNAANQSAWISFTKLENGTVTIDGEGIELGLMSTITDLSDIEDWIDNSASSIVLNSGVLGDIGLTDYNTAFTEARHFVYTSYDQDRIIFISDGSYNDGGSYSGARQALLDPPYDVDSIRAVGIDMGNILSEIRMNGIDTTGAAEIIESDQLTDVMIDLMTQDVSLDPTGDDEIEGNAGNDLIFGDVLNTDGVFEDLENEGYDLSTIEHLPDGSGWEVFVNLELANPGEWTRANTLRYIRENHEELAKETVFDEGGPNEERRDGDGGSDIIEGGDGDDIIYGQEGNDIIDAGSGNDVVDGGTGFDTLMVNNATELDFSNVSNIEMIHLNEGGAQNLILSLDEVLEMTENGILQVTGEDGVDSVTLTGVGSGWTQVDPTNNPGLFSNGSETVNIAERFDGINIHVDVQDPTGTATDFDV